MLEVKYQEGVVLSGGCLVRGCRCRRLYGPGCQSRVVCAGVELSWNRIVAVKVYVPKLYYAEQFKPDISSVEQLEHKNPNLAMKQTEQITNYKVCRVAFPYLHTRITMIDALGRNF